MSRPDGQPSELRQGCNEQTAGCPSGLGHRVPQGRPSTTTNFLRFVVSRSGHFLELIRPFKVLVPVLHWAVRLGRRPEQTNSVINYGFRGAMTRMDMARTTGQIYILLGSAGIKSYAAIK